MRRICYGVNCKEIEEYFEESSNEFQEFSDEKQVMQSYRIEKGVYVTAFYEGKIGTAYQSGFNKNQLEMTLHDAMQNAEYFGKRGTYSLSKQCCNESNFKTLSKVYNDREFDFSRFKEILAQYDIAKIKRLKVRKCTSNVKIKNTAGFNCGYNSQYIYLIFQFELSSAMFHSCSIVGHDVSDLFKNLYNNLSLKFKKAITSQGFINRCGEFPVLLSCNALATIISFFSNIFIGRNASVRIDLLNKLKNTHGIITITDKGNINSGFASAPFDCEARNTQNTIIVKDGRLSGFFWDALDEEKGIHVSTGNKMKDSYKGRSYIAPTNLIINGGKHDVNNLITSISEGFYIDKIGYIPGSIDNIMGNFSFYADGYYIEKGKLKYYIPRLTLSGNIKNIFSDIIALSSYKEWIVSKCVVEAPAALVNSMKISW